MEWYGKHYGKILLVPALLIILSVLVISSTVMETGSFVRKGVSLTGGVSATAAIEGASVAQLEEAFARDFPQADFEIRRLGGAGAESTFTIAAADIAADEQEAGEIMRIYIEENYATSSVSIETTGPSLGEAFFTQTVIGILLAFLWMGWVVFLYFGEQKSIKFGMGLLALVCTVLAAQGVLDGTVGLFILLSLVLGSALLYFFVSVPSGAVILAALSTILFTLAVIDLFGVRLSTAGVAAFLMLIGYSVDTDILLSTRVLKSREGTVAERIHDSFITGTTMQVTTMVAVALAFVLATSEVIQQIMLIIFVGMIGDFIFSWLQNAGIIYWYMQRKGVKA